MKIGNVILKEIGEFTTKMCLVGPKEAHDLLKFNTHNRKIRDSGVNKYVDEILRGAWVPLSSGIGFNEDGVLIDGQHRLTAIEKSGATVRLLVTTDLPKLAQEKVDTQIKRSLSDVLGLSGFCKNTVVVQTAVYMAKRNSGWGANPSNEEVKETITVHSDALYAVADETKYRGSRFCSVGTRAAIVVAYELWGEKALKFYKSLQSDLHTTNDDPAYRLRNALVNVNKNGGAGFQEMTFTKTCYAFNAFIKGKKLTSVLSADDIIKPEE